MDELLHITIACLPVAGSQNPYQDLMMSGLNQDGRLRAFNGADDRFFGIGRTVVRYGPRYLHFDWIASFYFRRWRWLTWLSVGVFCGQILLARGLGVKLVWTLHNVFPHDAAQHSVHRFCQRFLARNCVWIRVFSPDTIVKAAPELRVPASKFRVVPEGDYTRTYPNQVSRETARSYLEIPLSSKVFLYLGLIKPYKGIAELVETFKQIHEPNSTLLIAGKVMDEAYGEKLRHKLAPNIRLVDKFIPENELQYYFKAADVVVLPFKNIENSGSLIMAMGFAKPVIAPRLGVICERLHQQEEWLYDSADELREKLYLAASATSPTLEDAGNRNFASLKRHTWQDFSPLFT